MSEDRITPRLFSIDGAVVYSGISRRTIERYIETGQLKTKRVERPGEPTEFLKRTLIPRSELDALIDRGIDL
jgi:hypothetical protein